MPVINRIVTYTFLYLEGFAEAIRKAGVWLIQKVRLISMKTDLNMQARVRDTLCHLQKMHVTAFMELQESEITWR